jgi:hypothetical protein
MGGAVAKVGKDIGNTVARVTGGKTSGQMEAEKRTQAAQAAQAAQSQATEKSSMRQASASDEMMGARMRGARRRGRQLLSDARLNAESGVQTLGGGQSLGQ